ncbi:hypothetical protein TNCV_4012031 [Trichonephila clavipes]|nr:hypothetical protein TNCV_4012031 [Trichonephila clavipes]
MCMDDTMPVNVPGSDLKSYCNTAKRRPIATTSSVVLSSSSSHKAAGVTIYPIEDKTSLRTTQLDKSVNLAIKYQPDFSSSPLGALDSPAIDHTST